MANIRLLTADDIDVRIGSKNKDKTKAQLLLYKDARVDMAVLDEVFGVGLWQSDYKLIGDVLFCGIGVWIDDKWVWKWSNGVESKGTGDDDSNNIKGEASDAFKRAGFMWGIGRELYNCKGIWVDIVKDQFYAFRVKEIAFNEKNLMPKKIIIIDQKGNVAYELGKNVKSENKPIENVEVVEPNIDTQNKEKIVDEPKNEVKTDINAQETYIKDKNGKIYGELIKNVFQELVKAEIENADKKSKEIVMGYFENTLKLKPITRIAKEIELTKDSTQEQPTISGRTLLQFNHIWLGSTDIPSLKQETDTAIGIYEMEKDR